MATTWGQTGVTPVLRREDKRRGLSCFCGLTNTAKVYTVYFHGSIDGAKVIASLRLIRRYLTGKVILVWDRLAAHRSADVRRYLAGDRQIDVEFLPAYSPALNPEEYCHGYAKQRIRNVVASSVNELLTAIEKEFNRIRRRPKLIQSFFAHAGLT